MCGIAGFVGRTDVSGGDIEAMLGALRHRGPDGAGVFNTSGRGWNITLGHRRLAIIDLEGGRQPMGNEDATVQITFNGEIYNFDSLRDRLQNDGHRFSTRSDTETIIHQFEQHGPDGFAALDGMFALAIWDQNTQTLTLARDRAGIKPLFYAPLPGGGMVFASELTSLLAHGQVAPTLDPRAVSRFFFHDYVPSPDSIVAGVRKLPPAHYLQWTAAGAGEPTPFWSFAEIPAPMRSVKRSSELVRDLRQLLNDSVQAQMIADVPLGVFLSGGIDSSIVAAVARRYAGRSLQTFSIGFTDADYDESAFARQAAEYVGTRHHEWRISEDDLMQAIDSAIGCLDEPIADPSILPTYLLCKLAAGHVKVALGGDGGDELWAGYPTYKAHRMAHWFSFAPKRLRTAAARHAARMPVRHTYQPLEWKAKRFLLRWEDELLLRHQHWMSNVPLASLPGAINVSDVPWNLHPAALATGGDRVNGVLAFDFQTYLTGAVLTKVDRASMANGLEVRPPLLANRMIDFAFALPSNLKLHGRTTKWLLKQAGESLLPRSILYRRKKGFAVPLARWMATTLRRASMRS